MSHLITLDLLGAGEVGVGDLRVGVVGVEEPEEDSEQNELV